MTTEAKETAQEISLVPFKTMVPSVAPLLLPVPNRNFVNIGLLAPKFRAELVKEEVLAEERRKAERRRIEQEQYTRSQQLSRSAIFQSD